MSSTTLNSGLTRGPLYRSEFRELTVDPCTTGPAARHSRRETVSIHLGLHPQVEAAVRANSPAGGYAQPVNKSQDANPRSAAAKAERLERKAAQAVADRRAIERRASHEKALALGRRPDPSSVSGRVRTTLRRSGEWMSTAQIRAAMPAKDAVPVSRGRISSTLTAMRIRGEAERRQDATGELVYRWVGTDPEVA